MNVIDNLRGLCEDLHFKLEPPNQGDLDRKGQVADIFGGLFENVPRHESNLNSNER